MVKQLPFDDAEVFLKVSKFVIASSSASYTDTLRGTLFPLLCCHGDGRRRRSMRRGCSVCDAAG